MSRFLHTFLFIFSISFSYSQILITGSVKTDNGNPLEGASIYIQELRKGTYTSADGEFKIENLKSGVYNLSFGYLGYQTEVRKITLADKDVSIIINLHPQLLEMNEVVVSSAFFHSQNSNPYSIDVVKKDNMPRTGAMTIMDMIEKVAGIDAVTTGPLVSRPIIRGLQGNRILTVVDGIRFETQQWDDEHGIGVNELGVEQVEIIKGPASLLYGAQAMGGVIHFIDENPAVTGKFVGEALATLYCNNPGGGANLNLKGATENYNWGINALGRLLSDYFYNGYDFRVPNTRLLEYGAKGYVGINPKWGSSTLSYTFNKAYYGILDGKDIVKNEQGQIINIDSLEKEKFPFEIEAPFHEVTDHRLNLSTTFLLSKSKIETVLGYQNNHRSENEELSGAKKGYTYLDMVLHSITYDAKWYLPEWNNFETIVGSQGMYQINKNGTVGVTELIPDANIRDLGFLALTKYNLDKLTASIGARYDARKLETLSKSNSDISWPGLNRDFHNISYSAGITYLFGKNLLARSSFASGYRSPNLNELMSNGVKLESQRYELGNVDFDKETNNEFDVSINYSNENFTVEGSLFSNSIDNYIYISPTGREVESNFEPGETYPEYQFQQSEAKINGGEALIDIHPSAIKVAHFESEFSSIKGTRKDDDSYLPMMPATKLSNTLYFNLDHLSNLKKVHFNLGTMTAFEQTQVAENEDETPGYTLLNAGLGGILNKTEINLTARNILDKEYLDHLSRFRSYEIIEPGLNISLSVKFLL